MRCPKCGYISFDYNQVCPKCNKDISEEQEKMNLPAFKPAPPVMLGSLTGETGGPDIGLRMGAASDAEAVAEGETAGLEDSADTVIEEAADEEIDMDISFEPEGEGEIEVGEGESEEISLDFDELPGEELEIGEEAPVESAPEDGEMELDLGELSFDESTPGVDAEAADMEPEDISLDLDGLPGEELEIGEEAPVESAPEDGEMELDLGELSLDESAPEVDAEAADMEPEDISMDLDDLTAEGPEAAEEAPIEPAPEDGEMELALGELSLDESTPGVDAEAERAGDEGEEHGIDLDSFILEGEGETQDAGESETDFEPGEIQVDLDDLKLDETGELQINTVAEPPEEADNAGAPEMTALVLDESASGEGEFGEIVIDDEESAIDFEPLTLDDIELPGAPDKVEEVQVDLDNLDLDFDMDEPEPKT